MKLGVSIPPQLILDRPDSSTLKRMQQHYGGAKSMLREFKDQGVTSIEIRYLFMDVKDEDHTRVCNLIWEEGLQLTAHGRLDRKYEGNTFVEKYPSFHEIIKNYDRYQKEVIMVLHAYSSKVEDPAKMDEIVAQHERDSLVLFKEWLETTKADGFPMKIGIELDHDYPGVAQPGIQPEYVVRMVDALNDPRVGITWDMGHYYQNLMLARGITAPPEVLIDEIPPASFLKKAIHTHIHGIREEGGHCSLMTADLPVEQYVQALKDNGYQGVYNLEISFGRLAEDRVGEEMTFSIQRLRDAVLA